MLSYVGGIFNSILAGFFFMNAFGMAFIELFIAKVYFKSKAAYSFGFFSFVKQTLFNVFTACGCNLKWKNTVERNKLRDTVNTMMDVIYLQRRI